MCLCSGLRCTLLPCLAVGVQVYVNTANVSAFASSSVMCYRCSVLLSSFAYCLWPPFCPHDFFEAPPLGSIHWHICVGGFNSATSRVLSVGVFFLAVRRITGRGTSSSAMRTIRIRCLMSLLSGPPNWVCKFTTFMTSVGLLFALI